jgi:LuxR family maltose regulon positive regulatory protein
MGFMDILLVDDHAATREEMVSLIEEEDDLDVVGQAADGEEGVRLARERHPDVVVMDVVMPGMNGIAATEAVLASEPRARVLALSNHTGANLVEVVLRAGATGYVRKDRAYEELVPAIRAVAEGKQYIGERVNE